MTPATAITATVMKPTVENGAWVNRPFVLTVTPHGISDKLAAESAAKAGKK
jgi:hypothetical protein